MSGKPKAIFCWSSGKDSALCLSRVLEQGLYEVCYLLTTVNDKFKRISMHGIREELLDLQAASIGIPLLKVRVREGTNEDYERQMEITLNSIKSEDIEFVIFGDIFLEDLRKYREQNLDKIGMKAVFPLWKQNTRDLIKDFRDRRFEALLCCTNSLFLGQDWLGRKIDNDFLSDLPGNVDPCGENGEYHTFCYGGSLFKKPLNFSIGTKLFHPLEMKTDEEDGIPQKSASPGFWFCDLVPEN